VKFSSLRFYERGAPGRRDIEAFAFFDNGYGAFVAQGPNFPYSDPRDDTYEIYVLEALVPHPTGRKGDSELTFDTPVADEVLGNLTRDDVERVLGEIAALPPRSVTFGPLEREATFSISMYDSDLIESNAREDYGRRRRSTVFNREEVLEAGLATIDGDITEAGWDELRDDEATLEKNSLAWLRRKFKNVRDEGRGRARDARDLVGTFSFDAHDLEEAELVQLGIDERIDMIDGSYGDLNSTVWTGVGEFGANILGGQINFEVEPDVRAEIEETLDRSPSRAGQRRGWRSVWR